MRPLWYTMLAVVLVHTTHALPLTVEHVKVTVTAESAAAAREKALDKAHHLAFLQLIQESYPDHTGSPPPTDTLREMVIDFSIDREKTTPTSYTASLTFQFDEPKVVNWLERGTHKSSASFAQKSESLKVTASYQTHGEWQHIKSTLENFPDIQSLTIFTLSLKNASIGITHRGSIDQLKQELLRQNIHLTQQEGEWVISADGQGLH